MAAKKDKTQGWAASQPWVEKTVVAGTGWESATVMVVARYWP